jgi:hypothetical protein
MSNTSRWVIAAVLAVVLGVVAFLYFRPARQVVVTGDPETRIIAYLKENVQPGKPVYVTELYNNVFTTSEERAVLERLHNMFFKIPAAAAQIYMKTGRMPTLQELSDQFQLKVPGEMDVLLRIMESDPRVPKFFERNPATGEITKIDVDRIAATEHFGDPLRSQ